MHIPAAEIEAHAAGETTNLIERGRVLSHARACEDCGRDLKAWQTLFSALGSLPHLAPDDGFADAVMERVVLPVRRRVIAPVHAVLTGLIGVPAVIWTAALAWFLALPGVSLGGLVAWGAHAGRAHGSEILGALQSTAGYEAVSGHVAAVEGLALSAPGLTGGALLLFLPLASLSTWVLFRYGTGPTPRGQIAQGGPSYP